MSPRPRGSSVGYEYAMSPVLLLGAIEQARAGKEKFGQSLPAARLYEPQVADRLTELANLSVVVVAVRR